MIRNENGISIDSSNDVKLNFTDLLNYQNIKTINSIQQCEEYSEDFKALQETLKDCEFSVRYNGIHKWNASDNETMLINVMIIRKNHNPINFDFHMSFMDTAKINIENAQSYYKLYMEYFKCIFPYARNTYMSNMELMSFRKKLNKDKRDIKNGLLYSILCCIRSDFYIEDNFNDFCDVFGCDNDSISAMNLHRDCLKQSKLLKMIFTDEEIENFTS